MANKDKERIVNEIISTMSSEDKKEIREVKSKELILYHRTLGRSIRNHYKLHHDKKLVESVLGKPGHADDASMVIIKEVWKVLQDSKQ